MQEPVIQNIWLLINYEAKSDFYVNNYHCYVFNMRSCIFINNFFISRGSLKSIKTYHTLHLTFGSKIIEIAIDQIQQLLINEKACNRSGN